MYTVGVNILRWDCALTCVAGPTSEHEIVCSRRRHAMPDAACSKRCATFTQHAPKVGLKCPLKLTCQLTCLVTYDLSAFVLSVLSSYLVS